MASIVAVASVEGPIPVTDTSRPFGTVDIPQSAHFGVLVASGYVEEEFFISGATPLVAIEGGTTGPDLAYTTRILVRRPTDPARFSGTVVMEPFHQALEMAPAWPAVYRQLLRRGDAWVGVTVHAVDFWMPSPPGDPVTLAATPHATSAVPSGLKILQMVDAARYAQLELARVVEGPWVLFQSIGEDGVRDIHDPDGKIVARMFAETMPQAPGIISQVGNLLKGGDPRLLGGGRAQRLYGHGYSGTGMFWKGFIDGGHHDAARRPGGGPVLDGYLVGVWMEPQRKPADAVVAFVASESEVARYIANGWHGSEDSDDPPFRVYEVAGSSHGFAGQGSMDATGPMHQLGIANLPTPPCVGDHSTRPLCTIIHAIHANMDRWVKEGVPMPRAPRLERDPGSVIVPRLGDPLFDRALGADGIARDEHGNARGGLRNPWVDVPNATYRYTCACGGLTGTMWPFPDAKLRSLYGEDDDYRRQFAASVDQLVDRRWLIEEDASFLKRDPHVLG